MPKKAVAIFFIAAFIGAVLFVYFTFPRTKDEIPQSNNQRPFPSAPPQPTPNSVPVPETVPHPTAPKVPPGPSLRVMAWGNAAEAQVLQAEADAFSTSTGRHVSLTIDTDLASYRTDLQQVMASNTPPDVCLIDGRGFAGLDPSHDLATVSAPDAATAPRTTAAFTINGDIKALPDEFSVDVLFYNPTFFDQAGFGYPGAHWNWDILESIARGMTALKLQNTANGQVYPVEMTADFDLWNILSTQAGHSALDLDTWHLDDPEAKDSHVRGLDLIHELFQVFAITAPLQKSNQPAGQFFAEQRAAIFIGPSDIAAMLPASLNYTITPLPSGIARASLARVNGWAVTAKSTDPDAARALASYLAWQPVHAGWDSARIPTSENATQAVCYQVLDQALLPRVDSKSERLAQFLDQQIGLLARTPEVKTDALYARFQSEYRNDVSPAPGGVQPASASPKTDATEQIRGL